ncbi:MAG TPA: RNA polymerase sigma factor [Candidatus Sulfotelmatobacter sp.]|nr:RNA polymerase sigma factor [Candidatus Sulfotelmatobacter sp.]
MSTIPTSVTAQSELRDEEVVARVLAGETALFEILMRRYNQRLYRVSRAILREDGEAEDVMQDAYVRAYEHLDQFAGRAAFSTWLTRIAIHEALARKRRRGRMEELDALPTHGDAMSILKSSTPTPEAGTAQAQMRQLLEEAIDRLPETYRSVVVLREVEEMSVAETAESLGVTDAVVKTRLHRAHAMLRKDIYSRSRGRASDLYQFHALRCDRVVKAVFERIKNRNWAATPSILH